jgi:proteasome lid subunit RPN8/RPN11
MKYLRAVIDLESQGTLYKKDFQVQKVFSILARTFASILITTNIINEGDSYRALIVPRYGLYQPIDSSLANHRVIERTIELKGPWISLDYQEPLQPDRPIDFFSVDVYVPQARRIYRASFQMKDMNYFWQNIESALVQAGIVPHTSQLQRKLYARDDEQANFAREEVFVRQQDTDPLIEIIPGEEVLPSFPGKTFADLPIVSTKKLVRGKLVTEPYVDTTQLAEKSVTQQGVHILVTETALAEVQEIARSGIRVEQGGVLVGRIYEDQDSHKYFVEITDHIAAEGAVANEVELRYTFESWQHQNTLLKERFPGKRIVGWYHTHLDLVKKTFTTNEPQHSTYTTPLFFSQDDLFTHRQFFREKWYVAMVLDPAGNLTFFQWNGDTIGESSSFYVISSQIEE